jgi:hypothetical protein
MEDHENETGCSRLGPDVGVGPEAGSQSLVYGYTVLHNEWGNCSSSLAALPYQTIAQSYHEATIPVPLRHTISYLSGKVSAQHSD